MSSLTRVRSVSVITLTVTPHLQCHVATPLIIDLGPPRQAALTLEGLQEGSRKRVSQSPIVSGAVWDIAKTFGLGTNAAREQIQYCVISISSRFHMYFPPHSIFVVPHAETPRLRSIQANGSNPNIGTTSKNLGKENIWNSRQQKQRQSGTSRY
jgi:hypothetical protein